VPAASRPGSRRSHGLSYSISGLPRMRSGEGYCAAWSAVGLAPTVPPRRRGLDLERFTALRTPMKVFALLSTRKRYPSVGVYASRSQPAIP